LATRDHTVGFEDRDHMVDWLNRLEGKIEVLPPSRERELLTSMARRLEGQIRNKKRSLNIKAEEWDVFIDTEGVRQMSLSEAFGETQLEPLKLEEPLPSYKDVSFLGTLEAEWERPKINRN